MKNTLVLGALLVIFWLIDSGYFKPMLLGFGAASVVFVLFLHARMVKQDKESFPPVVLSFSLVSYAAWLVWQIVKSNIDVARRVWQKSPAIQPSVFTVKASQKTETCRVLYANSITLTPGTVTLSVHGDKLEVHALTKESAADLKTGEMDHRVTVLEGGVG